MINQFFLLKNTKNTILFISSKINEKVDRKETFKIKNKKKKDYRIVNSGRANLSNNALLDDDLDLGIIDDVFNFSGEPAGPVDGYGDPPFLNDFLGVSLEELDGNTFALEGSALKSTLTVKAGETLVFDWNFYTNENSPQTFGPLDDYSFFVINGELLTLGTPNEALHHCGMI